MPTELLVTAVVVIVFYILPEVVRRIRKKPIVYPKVTDKKSSDFQRETVRPRYVPETIDVEVLSVNKRVVDNAGNVQKRFIPEIEEAAVNNDEARQNILRGMIWHLVLQSPRSKKI